MSELKHNDLRVYLRLLRYLRGTRKLVVLLLVAMVCEGLFTVCTISMLKPILDLLEKNRISDTSKYTETNLFTLGEQRILSPDTVGVKAVGDLSGIRASEELRDCLAVLIKPPYKRALVDLSRTPRIDSKGWSQIIYAKLQAEQSGVDTQLVIPQGLPLPQELTSSKHFQLLTADSAQFAQMSRQELASVSLPVQKKKRGGILNTWKRQWMQKAAPTIDSVQDYVSRGSSYKFRVLAVIIGVMLVFAVLMTVAGFATGYLSSYLGNVVVLKLRGHIYEHMLTLDLHYFNSNSIGGLMSVVTQDVNAVEHAISVIFSSVLKTPITVCMLIIAMFIISPSLTLFSFTVLPVIGLMLYMLGRRVRRISQGIQRYRAVLQAVLQEAFTGMRVVKAFNMEEHEASKFRRENQRIFRMGLKTVSAEELGSGLTGLLGFVAVGIMVLAGGYYIIETKELSRSDFVLFVGFLTQVFRPLKSTSRVNSRIQRGLAGCDRVFHVLDMKPSICDRPEARDVEPLKQGIDFEDVWFAYGADRTPVLRGINLKVKAGQAIAIVGETGAGKSTLVNLLPRFYDATQGSVKYDGIDIRDIRIRSLRNQIAVITQDVILFDDSVANNISYGCTEKVSQEQIEAAAIAANAHKFISKLPEGYSTMVGSRGVRLSGGERQRIAIARAILKNSPILILDEATSSLDSETEALIQEALARVIEGRTVFVIAHRLSTIQNCDEIYVVENGQFVEHGNHEELLRLGGRYARYYNIQFGKLFEAPAPSEVTTQA